MKKSYSIYFLILFLFCFENSQAQSIEEIKKGLTKAGNTILGYMPKKIAVDESYNAKVEIEFPNGFNLQAKENTQAVLNYKWEKGKSLKLLFNIDADGNIIADKHHLMNIFKTDWDINWTLEFDSKGMKKSAQEYYNYAKDRLVKWWNN